MDRREIQYAVLLVGIGCSLLAYAHANFPVKSTITSMQEDIREIRRITWDIKVKLEKRNN